MNTGTKRVEKTCENCKNTFSIKLSHRHQKFCTQACKAAHETAYGRVAAQVPAVEFKCRECAKPFFYKPAMVRAYEKKFGLLPRYCSIPCSAIGRQKDATERARFTCAQCGKEHNRRRKPGGRIYAQQKFCSQECKVANQMARAQKRFDEGGYKKHIKRNGYVWMTVPTLSRNGGSKHVMEHRYIMSKHLGRDLFPEETVHHIDGNRQHNLIGNLELFSSRHGPGQRVIDKIAFAIEILTLYPEFAQAAGVKLVHLTAALAL
jgi:hypothetical protein